MIKIAIIGTESSGKTTLAAGLSNYFGTDFVQEYAREYLEDFYQKQENQKDSLQKNTIKYSLEDIENIAKKQYQNIENSIGNSVGNNVGNNIGNTKKSSKLVVADTELIVMKIWSENSFKTVSKWILEHIEKQNFDLYLLTSADDIAWEYDPLREHEDANERKRLFECYQNELEKYKFNYQIISGKHKEDRLKQAIQSIEKLLKTY